MDDLKIPDSFNLGQLFGEMNSRVKLSPYRWAGQPDYTPPDYCACRQCRQMRLQLLDDLHEGMNQQTCANEQHRQYCDVHSRFYHHMDVCPDCKEPQRKSPIIWVANQVPYRCVICGQVPCVCKQQPGLRGLGPQGVT